jgi:hypothetical protein
MQTIHVDAFNTPLHGATILCQGPFPKDRLPSLLESVQHSRDPFKKRVLLTKALVSIIKTIPINYDASFQVSDIHDWTQALTYILHCPKPTMVIADDVIVPDGIWARLTKGITFIHISNTSIKNSSPYDTIFFAPIQDITSAYADYVFRQIQAIFRASYTQQEYKGILQELRVAEAGLAWTKIKETTPSGSIYWYDTVANQGSDILSKKQLSNIFLWLHSQCVD